MIWLNANVWSRTITNSFGDCHATNYTTPTQYGLAVRLMGTPKFSHLMHATACATNHIFLNRLLTQDLSFGRFYKSKPLSSIEYESSHVFRSSLSRSIPEEIRTLTEPILSRTPLPVGLREHNSVSFFITFFTTQRLDTIGWSTLPLHFHRLDPKAMWKTRSCIFQITNSLCITNG